MASNDWRSDAAYEYLRDLDPADLAWEFLRRNPEYRRDHERIRRENLDPQSEADRLRRWGLRFRN